MKQIELYEDNAGGLFLVPVAEGIAILMLPDGDFLSDARLYDDSWSPEDCPEHVYPVVHGSCPHRAYGQHAWTWDRDTGVAMVCDDCTATPEPTDYGWPDRVPAPIVLENVPGRMRLIATYYTAAHPYRPDELDIERHQNGCPVADTDTRLLDDDGLFLPPLPRAAALERRGEGLPEVSTQRRGGDMVDSTIEEQNEEMYMIWSWAHLGWWRPERSGYTGDVLCAGWYEKEDAEEICERANRFFEEEQEVAFPRSLVFAIAAENRAIVARGQLMLSELQARSVKGGVK